MYVYNIYIFYYFSIYKNIHIYIYTCVCVRLPCKPPCWIWRNFPWRHCQYPKAFQDEFRDLQETQFQFFLHAGGREPQWQPTGGVHSHGGTPKWLVYSFLFHGKSQSINGWWLGKGPWLRKPPSDVNDFALKQPWWRLGMPHDYHDLGSPYMDKSWSILTTDNWWMIKGFVQKRGIPPNCKANGKKSDGPLEKGGIPFPGKAANRQVLRSSWLAKAFSCRCSKKFTSVSSVKILITILSCFHWIHPVIFRNAVAALPRLIFPIWVSRGWASRLRFWWCPGEKRDWHSFGKTQVSDVLSDKVRTLCSCYCCVNTSWVLLGTVDFDWLRL